MLKLKNVELTVVIPCFRSPSTLIELLDEIREAVLNSDIAGFEIVLVADGRQTAKHLDSLLAANIENWNLRRVNLADNRGEQIALMAGVMAARGQIVVTIDDDGQHDPAFIPRFVEDVRANRTLVFGKPTQVTQGIIKSVASRTLKKMARLLGVSNAEKISSYRAFPTSETRRALSKVADFDFAFDALLVTIYGEVNQIEASFRVRREGRSGYNFSSLSKHALDLVISSSLKPLRYTLIMGFLVLFLSSMLLLTVLFDLWFLGNGLPDWVSTGAALGVLTGIHLVSMSLIGEYVARSFSQSRRLPLFRVMDKSFGPSKESRP